MNKKRYIGVIVLLLFSFLIQEFILDIEPVQERWIDCVEFLQEGTLYGGQPLCIDGPVGFMMFAFIFTIFGSNFQIGTLIALYVLHFIIIVMIINLLEKRKKNPNYLLVTLLYVFFVILPLWNEANALFVTFFFFSATYILLVKKGKWSLLCSGLLFALAIWTKLNALPFFAMFLLIYLLKDTFKQKFKKIIISKEEIKRVCWVIFGIVLASLLLIIIFPNMLKYTFLGIVGADITQKSIGNVINFFTGPFAYHEFYESIPGFFNRTSTMSAEVFFLAGLFMVSLYLFLKKRDILTSFTFFSFTTFLFLLLYKYNFFRFRYILVIFPFFVVVFVEGYVSLKKVWQRRAFGGIVMLLVFSLLMSFNGVWSVETEKFENFQKKVNGGLVFLPENITILTEKPHVLKNAGYNLQEEQYDHYKLLPSSPIHIDQDQLTVFKERDIMSEEWRELHSKEREQRFRREITENIIKKKYDVIHLQGYNEGSPLFMHISYLLAYTELNKLNKSEFFEYGCEVEVIHIEECLYCKNSNLLLFKDAAMCKSFADNHRAYYQEMVKSMCATDKVVFHWMSGLTNETCESGGNFYTQSIGKGILNGERDVWLLIVLLSMGILAFPFFVQKKQGN